MKNTVLNRRFLIVCCAGAALFLAGVLFGQSGYEKPNSVIHVVTLDWASGASQADIDAALKGVETMAEKYDGITRIWLRSIKSQTKDAAFVMEFKDEQALKDYAGSEAQQEWYKVYLKARGRSVTSDITN